MIYKLCVPGLVADVEEVRVLEWHGAVARRFDAGDMIVELETHKALVEVRAGQPGLLRRIVTPAGSWQRIGMPLCILSDAADEPLPPTPDAAQDLLVEFEIT
jgi:pyruvate/2-oxoglutarate dehydrogenase complex dihydrolipoamide acyltransferase (E2) component